MKNFLHYWKNGFEMYYDELWDACCDSGIGTPYGNNPLYLKFYNEKINPKGNEHNQYIHFIYYLWKKRFDYSWEVDFFDNKYLNGRNSREASYQVLTYEYEKWIYLIWEYVEEDRLDECKSWIDYKEVV